MEPYAEASCGLEVNVQCQACKMKLMEVLGSICGIYDVDINSEEGLARVQGVVEPNIFLKALAGTRNHAEPKWVKLRHPKMNRNCYYNGDYDSLNCRRGYNYGAVDNPYNYRGALPNYVGHPTHQYSTSDPYYYGLALPPAMWSYARRRAQPFHL